MWLTYWDTWRLTPGANLAPCTHCSFVLLRSLIRSRYAFSTLINSCNIMFRRTQSRTHSIRSAEFLGTDAKMLGLKEGDVSTLHEKGRYPLLRLAAVFNSKLLTRSRPSPFNGCTKDGYDLNIIAPDHLLTGLMKGILYCTFTHMAKKRDCDRLQILLKASLLEFGFQTQSLFFRNKKLVPGLSMSMMYAIFTVMPALLSSIGALRTLPTKTLIINIHTFCCLGFRWPSSAIDGIEAWNFVHGVNKRPYHTALHRIASNFVNSVDRYVQKNPKLGRFVDRPNTYRLIELTVHTLPLYNHLLYVCELVFEAAHQPLKFLLSRNNTANSHINSVQVILVKDWLQRIWTLWSIWKSSESDAHDRTSAMLSLMRLFCGVQFDSVQWDREHMSEYKKQIEDHIVSVLSGTVEKIFKEWFDEHSMHGSSEGAWYPLKYDTLPTLQGAERQCVEAVMMDLGTVLDVNVSQFKVLSEIAFRRRGTSTSSTGHEKIGVGDVVQVLQTFNIRSSRFVQMSDDVQGNLNYFVVSAILESTNRSIWLITKRCSLSTSPVPTPQIPSYNEPLLTKAIIPPSFVSTSHTPHATGFSYIPASSNVRKVGVVHNCKADKGCVFSIPNRTARHSRTTLQGGNFFLITRSSGYPPRRS